MIMTLGARLFYRGMYMAGDKAAARHYEHPYEPVWSFPSRLLILGTFPSPASRENGFYYGHSRNRFWRVTAAALEMPEPATVEEKTDMLLSRGIALWDVLQSCEVSGSSDLSIRNGRPNDIPGLLSKCGAEKILLNGAKAFALYEKHCACGIPLPYTRLPSTSPANAAWSDDRLTEAWRRELIS